MMTTMMTALGYISIPIEDDGVPGTHGSTQSNNSTAQQFQRVQVRLYRSQPSLSTEMELADLILLCRNLVGSIDYIFINKINAKAKDCQRSINSKLMDNNQTELADELTSRNHIYVTRDCVTWTTEDRAKALWKKTEDFSPVPFVGGVNRGGTDEQELKLNESNQHVSGFQRIVDQVMGFQNNWSAEDSTMKTQ